MRMGYGLELQQTQKLIITPELRQAITILQLSSLELELYVQQQIQENPVLEVNGEQQERTGDDGDSVDGLDDEQGETADLDIDWEEYFQDSSDLGMPKVEPRQVDYEYENFLSKAPSLGEHLLMQIRFSNLKGLSRKIGEYLVGNIDDNGYLRCSVGEVARSFGVQEDKIIEVLKVIQGFDPPGVGARDLRECLLIQLDYLGINDYLLMSIINRHLPDLANGRLGRIAQKLGISIVEVQQTADMLQQLDPKPGRNFAGSNDVRYVTPDVVLEKVEGEYVILINDTSIPRLTINSTYRSVLVQEQLFDKATRRYVESKLNAATWLIRSIEQRRTTLYKITKCLVDLQRDFLEYGVKYLKPLNLKRVADMVDLHESTVSRATANKYIDTPRGLLEMKFFFSTGLASSTGMTSAESVKKMIQEIIEGEDPTEPLNDKKIADILKYRGIKISRRTVAKYRSELNIPPINRRRRY